MLVEIFSAIDIAGYLDDSFHPVQISCRLPYCAYAAKGAYARCIGSFFNSKFLSHFSPVDKPCSLFGGLPRDECKFPAKYCRHILCGWGRRMGQINTKLLESFFYKHFIGSLQ